MDMSVVMIRICPHAGAVSTVLLCVKKDPSTKRRQRPSHIVINGLQMADLSGIVLKRQARTRCWTPFFIFADMNF